MSTESAVKRVRDLKLLDTFALLGTTARVMSISIENGLHRIGIRFLCSDTGMVFDEQFIILSPNASLEVREYC